jgi:hypothetical protein
MTKRTTVLLGVTLAAAVAAGVGTGFAARPMGPTTQTELVASYDQLANAILGSKNAETHLAKAICADAYRQAMDEFDLASKALAATNGQEAAIHLEQAAQAVYLISQEGDKAVAAVRNRLLEGGHHHHATAEIAAKYPLGFVVVTKEAQLALVAASKDVAKLASDAGAATADTVANARKKVEDLYHQFIE